MLVKRSIIRGKEIFALLPLIASFIYFLTKAIDFPIHDFINSYFPAFIFNNGSLDLFVFDPLLFNQKIRAAGIADVFASFNPNPPSVAIFFSPFALLPVHEAKIIFVVLSFSAFLLSIYRLCRYLDVTTTVIFIIIPFVFFTPLKSSILFGQTYLLLVSILIEGFLAYSKKKIAKCSIYWATAIFLKIFPVIILLFLLLRKEYKQARALIIACSIFLLLVIILQGFDVWKYYFLEVLPRSSSGDLHSAYTTATQSAFMFLKFLFQQDGIFNAKPYYNSIILFPLGVSTFGACILTSCIYFIKRSQNPLLSFSFLMLGVQLLSPQGSSYSNIMLILLIIALYNNSNLKEWLFYVFVILIISNLPVGLFKFFPLPINFPRLLLLLFLFSLIAFQLKAWPNWRVVVGLVILIFAPKMIALQFEKDTSTTFIDSEYNPLMVDFGVKDNHIYYSYWSDDGLNTKMTDKEVTKLSTKDLTLRNNQIFYMGIQITNSSDNKKQPYLVNDKEAIYLSDKGKGIKFYAIRKIALP